jgi:thiamine biosynthesis lipoprotein
VITDDAAAASAAAARTFILLSDYEERFSRFKEDSELSILNATKKAPVSKTFLTVLTRSLELHSVTEGAFNPLVQVKRLGYQSSFTPDDTSIKTTEEIDYDTDVTKIVIDEITNTVRLASGQELDFGGFLKGYLAELIAKKILETTPSCQGVIVNLGGDLATYGTDANGEIFAFTINNPITQTPVSIPLRDITLATSGTYARTWQTDGGIRHHIVDSNTHQNPTQSIVSASVMGSDGAFAEALTKVFLTRDVEKAKAIAARHHCRFLLITSTGDIIETLTNENVS